MRKEMKTLSYKEPWCGETLEVFFVVDSYIEGGRPYIGMKSWNEEYEFWESYCDVTVNIPYSCVNLKGNERMVECIVDTNNVPNIDNWLVENGIAFYTKKKVHSGFCEYPVLLFDMK